MKADIDAVIAAPEGGADRQIKVVDVGKLNVGVGVLTQGARKTAAGEPVAGISHAQVTEVYYVLSGSGVLITGTEIDGPVPLAADSEVVKVAVGPSLRATFMGGERRTVSAGDVVVIPAGVLHGWVEIPEQVRYLSIRPDPDRVLPAGYVNPAHRAARQMKRTRTRARGADLVGRVRAGSSSCCASTRRTRPAAAIERTADGKPDLNGIWQALVPANWDIRPHEARPAPLDVLGASGAEPPT